MDVYEWMSPQERLARYRTANPSPEKPKRPYQVRVELTADEQQELDALPAHERLTKFRAIQMERGKAK